MTGHYAFLLRWRIARPVLLELHNQLHHGPDSTRWSTQAIGHYAKLSAGREVRNVQHPEAVIEHAGGQYTPTESDGYHHLNGFQVVGFKRDLELAEHAT